MNESMKYVGYVLIAAGFVAGALVAVLDETSIMWGYFGIAMAVGAGGVGLVHATQRQRGRETGVLQADLDVVEESLEIIVANMRELDEEKARIDTYQVRRHIDDTFSADRTAFVTARESIGRAFGLDAYADVMTHYAAGERYLNRVWSASADGYIDEVHTYIERAKTQFLHARDRVRELRNEG